MPNKTNLKLVGLHTFQNTLSSVPEGALLEAVNINIDRNNVAEPRRGFGLFGMEISNNPNIKLEQLFTYKNRLLVHYQLNGTFTSFTINSPNDTVVCVDHGLNNNEKIYIYAENGTYIADSTITLVDINTFTIPTGNLVNGTSYYYSGVYRLAYDSTGNGDWVNFDGNYYPMSLNRIKGVELNGNFYFNTDEGIKKISINNASQLAPSIIKSAGGVKALTMTAAVKSPVNYGGFLNENYEVAYRMVWGYRDNNQNLILGSPSSRLVVTNTGPINSVQLTIYVPDEIKNAPNPTEYFYQLYRTASVDTTEPDQSPSEEYNLVAEEYYTGGGASTVLFEDFEPESTVLSSASLYTNTISGEGIQNANEPPPLAEDLAIYKNTLFYSKTISKNKLSISLLDGDNSLDNKSFIIKTQKNNQLINTETYTFKTTPTLSTDVGTKTTFRTAGATTSLNVPLNTGTVTASNPIIASTNHQLTNNHYIMVTSFTGLTPVPQSAYRIEIHDANSFIMYDQYNQAYTSTAAGSFSWKSVRADSTSHGLTDDTSIVITNGSSAGLDGTYKVKRITDNTFFVLNLDGSGATYNAAATFTWQTIPDVEYEIDYTAQNLIKAINTNPNSSVYAYYLSNSSTLPGQFYLEAKELDIDYFYLNVSNSTISNSFTPSIPTSGITNKSDNENKPNRLFYSKYQQPEAVPLVNYIDIGPQDKAIQRIIGLRDSLFIFKQDGIYRLTGDAGNYAVAPFDNSAILLAPDSAVVLNNQVYAFSTQGIITVTDTGVSVISRPIENKLLNIIRPGFSYEHQTFGLAYETDRAFLLFTVTNQDDITPTQVFRFNTFTNTWTQWDISKSCGIVSPLDDKLYLGATDLQYIEQERKNRDRTDFADRTFSSTVLLNQVFNNNTIGVSLLNNYNIGDVMIQTQYLTITRFNQLLSKLDNDPYIIYPSGFVGTLTITKGMDIYNRLLLLISTLNSTNLGNVFTYTGSNSSFQQVQVAFNDLLDQLDVNPVTNIVNYHVLYSTTTEDIEAIVIDLNKQTSAITTTNNYPFLYGPITVYQAYETMTTWAPDIMGDVSLLKQVSEATIIFENNNFTLASVAFSTDLSPGFESIDFTGQGAGDWGQFTFGEMFWGGVSNAKPLRTLIPLQKQRCRYINVKFTHKAAFEQYSLFGYSINMRPYSGRAYK